MDFILIKILTPFSSVGQLKLDIRVHVFTERGVCVLFLISHSVLGENIQGQCVEDKRINVSITKSGCHI